MILKEPDDKQPRMAELAERLRSRSLSAWERQRLQSDLRNLRRGVGGEREAAFYLNGMFANDEHHALLHDLRLAAGGETAQIDHLAFNCLGMFYLIETKSYRGNVTINSHGEFTVVYGKEGCFGVPSPIEQSHRHERVLRRVLRQLGIADAAGEVRCAHAVLFSPRSIITRPEGFATDCVMKADAFETWCDQWSARALATMGVRGVLGALGSVAAGRLVDWGERIKARHEPLGGSRGALVVDQPPPEPAAVPHQMGRTAAQTSRAARFGGGKRAAKRQ